ncbi:MAG TPA: hypothetical protein VJ692_12560 [Nitrospiraceae bacterium]|nr:hypothetical protein [Nitrospiraceae bacterium]
MTPPLQGSSWACAARPVFLLDRTVNAVFFATTIHLRLLLLMPAGYDISLGFLHLHGGHFRMSLFVCFAAACARAWRAGQRSGVPPREALRSPLLLFLASVLLYSLPAPGLGSGDTTPARYLPFSLVHEHDFDLDEFTFTSGGRRYFIEQMKDHVVSSYPPWAAVLATPVYLVPILSGVGPESPLVADLEKRSATLITACSVLVLLFALRRVTSEWQAWAIAVIYAFGTSSFSVSSQALWQHGSSQLFLSLAIYCLIRGLKEPRFSVLAVLPLGAAVICRPLDVVMAVPIVMYLFHDRRAHAIGILLAGIPAVALFMAYNTVYFGSPFITGFGGTIVSPSSFVDTQLSWFNTPLLEGLLGILASPGRGLLMYSPIFVFSFVGMVMVWKNPGNHLFKYLSLGVVLLLLPIATIGHWWGGHCYGPRLLADATPILCLLLVPAFELFKQQTWLKSLAVCLTAFSIGMHALGAFNDDSWNRYPNDINIYPERLWSWAESPPLYNAARLIDRF